MKKTPFLSLEKARQIAEQIPTPFHIYDEAGIRENVRQLKAAFAWNPGFREYFAVKATPNPYILKLFHEEGCGCDCASYAELLLCEDGSVEMIRRAETPKDYFATFDFTGLFDNIK